MQTKESSRFSNAVKSVKNYFSYNQERNGPKTYATNLIPKPLQYVIILAAGMYIVNNSDLVHKVYHKAGHAYYSLLDKFGNKPVVQSTLVAMPTDSSALARSYLLSGAACRDSSLSDLIHSQRKPNEVCYNGFHPKPAQSGSNTNANTNTQTSKSTETKRRSTFDIGGMIKSEVKGAQKEAEAPASK